MAVTVPTVTGWSSFWQQTGDSIPYAVLSRSAQGWRSKLEWELARVLNRNQMREIRELSLTLLGAAAGDTALSTYKRVSSPTNTNLAVPEAIGVGDLGGSRTIDTITVINRVTTAADITYLTSIYDGTMSPGNPNAITFVNDSGGNGANSNESQVNQ